MKKVRKNKKNWFKIQFKKHPYIYSVLLVWTIFIVPGLNGFYRSWSNKTGDTVVLILFLFTLATFFLWFRKDKSKIKPFYKRNKKIFKPILYFLGSIGSLIVFLLIAGIIATGGIKNFTERAKFEYLVLKNLNEDPLFCQRVGDIRISGPWGHFIFKESTQFLDYYDDRDVSHVIKKVIRLKDDSLFNFNHCVAERLLLKAAQKGDVDAQEMLISMPYKIEYIQDKKYFKSKNVTLEENYIFGRYFKKIKEMNLENPALAYKYALYVLGVWDAQDENTKEGIDYLVQSADAGYLRAMLDFVGIFSDDKKFDTSNCEKILRYNNYLAEQKEVIHYISLVNANMGNMTSMYTKSIYKCLDNKLNFSKAFLMINDFSNHLMPKKSKSSQWSSFYPALFFLNGWGEVNQNYEKAYELFTNNVSAEDPNPKYISQAYLTYMHFKGMGVEQNPNKGKGLTIELVKEIDLTETQKDSFNIELLCGGVNYNFIINDEQNQKLAKEYRDKMGQCLLESEPEVSIKFLEDFIKILMTDKFQNPELFETINYLGKAK